MLQVDPAAMWLGRFDGVDRTRSKSIPINFRIVSLPSLQND